MTLEFNKSRLGRLRALKASKTVSAVTAIEEPTIAPRNTQIAMDTHSPAFLLSAKK